MLNFIPFRALRPRPEYAHTITGASSEFSDDASLTAFLQQHPNNAMLLTKMQLIQPGLSQESEEYFRAIEEFSLKLRSGNQVEREAEPSFYIYKQWIEGVPHTGIVGLIDVENFLQGEIKRHEHTRAQREKFIGTLFERTGLITQPVLMGHKHHAGLEHFATDFSESNQAILELNTPTGLNQVWRVHDELSISHIRRYMEELESLYIMDGHHRIATVARLYSQFRDEAHRYLPAFLLDEHQLRIDPFHRVVQSHALTLEEFIANVQIDFEVTRLENPTFHSGKHGRFILISNGNSYQLDFKGNSSFKLDVNLFEELILKKQFGILDSRHDERLTFVKGREAIQTALHSSLQLDMHLFVLNPCTFDEIKEVSDRGEVMPPKSTSIEPKSRNGILMCEYGRHIPLFVR